MSGAISPATIRCHPRNWESQVNAMIKIAHKDFATLRRELYDNYLLDRADGIYRRTPSA